MSDLFTDTETSKLFQHMDNLGSFQQSLQEYGNRSLSLPKPNNCKPKICPDGQVLTKS